MSPPMKPLVERTNAADVPAEVQHNAAVRDGRTPPSPVNGDQSTSTAPFGSAV